MKSRITAASFRQTTSLTSLVLGGSLLLPGCQPSANETPKPAASAEAHDHDHDHDSDHPHHGPNGGDLIELGQEEYHAEFLHDDTGLLTIILLDSSAKNTVSIPAAEIQLNVKSADSTKQYAFLAEAASPEGQNSKFQLTDAELAKLLDQKGTEATLVVTINDKQYRGKLAHDHSGHQH